MNLLEILQSWILNPEYITSDEMNSDYIARREQRDALKKLPHHIAIPLKCFFEFFYYHRSSKPQNRPHIRLKALNITLKFLQDKENKNDIDSAFININKEILNYIKKPQTIEDYLGWWIVVFLYDKFPSYKHSEELDSLLWNNLERTLRNQIVIPNKDYLVKWLMIIARYDLNDPKDLRLKKIFLKLAFNWIVSQRKKGTDKNNDEILEILSAVNNIPTNFENVSDRRQFDDLKQKFAQLNFEYSVGEQKKQFYYRFFKKDINSTNDLFFDSLIHLRQDTRSGVTYSIWNGKLKSISTKVVVKCFSSSNEENLKKYTKEAYFLKKLSMKNDFFLRFYSQFYDAYINKTEERAFYIVMQHCKSTLGKEINYRIENGKIYEPFIAYDVYKLLEGFCQLIYHKVYHHDIKPDNIFIDEDGNYKIGDFGLSFEFKDQRDDETKTVQGTIDYMSPELREAYRDRSLKIQINSLSREKSDVFSLGLVFLKMITLKSISGLNTKQNCICLSNLISSVKPLWLSRLLLKMLHSDPEKRINFKNAFEELNKDEDFLTEKSYIIIENKLLTFSAQSSIYFIDKIKEKIDTLDASNDSVLELLQFIKKLDQCKIDNTLVKNYALQNICDFLINYFESKPNLERRESTKFNEIYNLINEFKSDNSLILKKIESFNKGLLKSTLSVYFTSDIILGNQYEKSDFPFNLAEISIEGSLNLDHLKKNYNYHGIIFDISQIETNSCELCINDIFPEVKIEVWKGHIKEDMIIGLDDLSNKEISIKIYTYQSSKSHNFGEANKNNNNSGMGIDLEERFENEAIAMKKLSGIGKTFLKYYGAFYQRFLNINKFYIITQSWKHSLSAEIHHLYYKKSKYSDYMISMNVYDIMLSVLAMKNKGILHHNLSTNTIVVSKSGYLKIIDFFYSLSEITEESLYETIEHTVCINSEEFAAPEQYLSKAKKIKFRREKADVFSLGLIFLSMAISEPIQGVNRDEEALCRAMSKVEVPWIARLLTWMLKFDYRQRPDIKEITDLLSTDEEFIYDLSRSMNQRKSMKNIFNNPLSDSSISFSQEKTKSSIQHINSSLESWSYSNDKTSIFTNNVPNSHEKYRTVDFFLNSRNEFRKYKKTIRQIKKFSGKRSLFLRYYGEDFQEFNSKDTKIYQAKLSVKIESCIENLRQFMERNCKLKDFQIAGIAYDIIRSLKYLCRKRIYVFDWNSDDFIFNEFGELKTYKYLKEFKYYNEISSHEGTPISFMSPEIIENSGSINDNKKTRIRFSREKAAVYSVGLIIFYLVMGQIDDILNKEKLSKMNPIWAKEILAIMLNPSNMDRPRFREIISAQKKNEDFQRDLDVYRLSQKVLHWPSNKKPTYLQNSKNSNCIIFDKNERRTFYMAKIKNNFEEFEMK